MTYSRSNRLRSAAFKNASMNASGVDIGDLVKELSAWSQLEPETREGILEILKKREDSEKDWAVNLLEKLYDDPEAEEALRNLLKKYRDEPSLLRKVKDHLEVPAWLAGLVMFALGIPWAG